MNCRNSHISGVFQTCRGTFFPMLQQHNNSNNNTTTTTTITPVTPVLGLSFVCFCLICTVSSLVSCVFFVLVHLLPWFCYHLVSSLVFLCVINIALSFSCSLSIIVYVSGCSVHVFVYFWVTWDIIILIFLKKLDCCTEILLFILCFNHTMSNSSNACLFRFKIVT